MMNPCIYSSSIVWIKNQPPPVNKGKPGHLADWSRQLGTASCLSTELAKTGGRIAGTTAVSRCRYGDWQARDGLSTLPFDHVTPEEWKSWSLPGKIKLSALGSDKLLQILTSLCTLEHSPSLIKPAASPVDQGKEWRLLHRIGWAKSKLR